ncbi:MFS transporter [Chiayiivirga flava]|uniref:1-acyl-sn-glycerol-3-phosphate acyltransferase n=1 Tax=Chiayiivirga flava TaxID=659595 RepID=A0A7W8FZI2_9GAMM|nr:MFS transporter [Chiayiivirga flava]MBB5208161.1 1-acyl-sn-glycerol-3-phosphate acyltransferase [Chiayiivirga flava]
MARSQFSLLRQRRFLPLFAVQAIDAFAGNLFRAALVMFVVSHAGLRSGEIDIYSNLAAMLFVLPLLVFSAFAGQWVEARENARLVRRLHLAGIGIALCAAAGLLSGSLALLLGALCGYGVLTALFGPLKYSLLPRVLRPQELIGGNALVVTSTFVGILLGAGLGDWLLARREDGPLFAAAALVILALAAWLCARAVPEAPAAAPALRIDRNPLRAVADLVAQLRGDRAVLQAVLGVSWAWFVGTVLLAQLPGYTRLYLGGDAGAAVLAMACPALGIVTGALLCERLSRRTVEIGLVPLGALGITLTLVDLYLARPQIAAVTGLPWRALLQAPGTLRLCADLLVLGVSAGFFTVPLYALIQQRTRRDRLARVIAANNLLNGVFMIAAAAFAVALLQAGFNVPQLWLALALVNVAVAVAIFAMVPEFVARFASWLVVKMLYRIELRGLEHIPAEGPALLVCNHVSYMDALLIMGAVPRPTRFVMYYRIFDIPGMNLVFRAARAIPIAGAKEDAAVMERAFEQIDAALAAGEIVGIFPEGALTKDGEIAPFRGGVERILAARPVPVVPMALCGMWQSMWSRRNALADGGPLRRMRLPRRIRARIGIVADAPIAPEQATAPALEAKVRALRNDRA